MNLSGKGSQKFKHFGIILLLGLGLLHPLWAEKQIYLARQPIGDVVSRFIDELGTTGKSFQVQKVYNPKSDGREGMLLRFRASGALCEILFFESPSNKNQSKLQVFAQDTQDARDIHKILTQKMNLKLGHVSQAAESNNSWPVQVNPK